MANNQIITYNLNAWRPINRKISFIEKIGMLAKLIKDQYDRPQILFLQEFIAGKEGKYLKYLEHILREYEVIMPLFDYQEHYKSINTVTLIRKDVLIEYRKEVLYSALANRANYVIANISGVVFHLMNIHCVQIANFKNQAQWYIDERIRLHREMWDRLISETEKRRDEDVIIAGDFQENTKGKNIKELIQNGYEVYIKNDYTVFNSFFYENSIDNIILSYKTKENLQASAGMIDQTQVGILSDHAIVSLSCEAI